MQQEMNQLFSRFFGEGEQAGNRWVSSSGSYVPRIESAVRDTTLCVKADLPGIDPKEIEVEVEGNRLTLRGQRKADDPGAGVVGKGTADVDRNVELLGELDRP